MLKAFINPSNSLKPFWPYCVALGTVIGGTFFSVSISTEEQPPIIQSLEAKPVSYKSNYDTEASLYFDKTQSMSNSSQCLPVHVGNFDVTHIAYYYCSSAALSQLGGELAVTRDFTVPAKLRRRVEFWRTIYSLWTTNDYVMHTAEYPELIFEVASSRQVSTDGPSGREDVKVKKFLKDRLDDYRTMLMAIHRQKNHVTIDTMSPSQKRVIMLMSHISDPDKYLKAANSLRIQRGQKDFIERGIEMSSPYLGALEQIFEDTGVPRDLAKIAFVESSFNTKALSKVGASGVYQLMPFTARQYMIVNNLIDERKDPIKSGYAAARLMKSYYEILGSWPLTVTSYNHGPYGLKNAIRAAGSNDVAYLIENYNGKGFGFASKNFFSEFLGVLITVNDKSRVFPNAHMQAPLQFKTVKLDRTMNLRQIVKTHKVSQQEFLRLNPGISLQAMRANVSLKRGHLVLLPDTNKEKLASTSQWERRYE